MKEIYYLLLVVITGLGSSLMTMYYPQLKRVIKRYIVRIRKPKHNHQAQIISLTMKIVELETQVNNLAEKSTNKENNLKRRVRAEVKTYLEELAK
jgi:hypothetical protein